MPKATYRDLKEEFNEKVEKLREECDHPEVSDWQREYWAPGHATQFEVKECKICRKIVAKRTECAKCGKLIEEDDFRRGDGVKRTGTEVFCPQCQEEWEKFVRKHPYEPESEEPVEVMRHLPGGGTVETEREFEKVDHYMRLHRKFMEGKADV